MPRKSSNNALTATSAVITNDTISDVPKKKRISKKDKDNENLVSPVVEPVVVEPVVVEPVVVKPKRGRKSKVELMASLNAATNAATNTATTITNTTSAVETIHLQVDEKETLVIDMKDMKDIKDNDNNADDNNDNEDKNDIVEQDEKKITKKRGRKPKGGKIIQNIVLSEPQKIEKPNVILHLKCSMKDLYQSSSCSVESYNFGSNELGYDLVNKNDSKKTTPKIVNDNASLPSSCLINDIKGFNIISNTEPNIIHSKSGLSNSGLDLSKNNFNSKYSNYDNDDDDEDYDDDDDDCSDKNRGNTKTIWRKLKQLEHNLHINNVNNKQSACFWCTCDFDNPPIYVPKHFINGTYHVYGCFCSPECAVAHLMNETIDSSAKFERYHLLNHIYSKIYDYKKNIKPAPNPYYMLEKFYGNLSIQEYRALLRNERLFLIVDKPLTRILPELHEDNDEFILNNKIIASNNYQLKSRMQKKKPSKGLIMNEKFGLAA
jgi:hypothetical protein